MGKKINIGRDGRPAKSRTRYGSKSRTYATLKQNPKEFVTPSYAYKGDPMERGRKDTKRSR